MTIQEIAEAPTTIRGRRRTRKTLPPQKDGDAWSSMEVCEEQSWHESLMRSYRILEYVQNLLEQGASGEAVLIVLKDLRGLPHVEMDGDAV